MARADADVPVLDATSARWRRRALLGAAALIAGVGVAYELSLMLLGTVTVGATEQANAIVLGAAMFGMGLGATGGGRLAGRPVRNFVAVESTLAVLGALAAPALYWTWARMDAFWGPLLAVAVALGVCIGAEMPLLAALNDRLARQSPARVVSAYTAADYFGALIGAVAFAFVLRPWLGIVDGTILVAAFNVAVAASVIWLVPDTRGSIDTPAPPGDAAEPDDARPGRRWRLATIPALAAVVLIAGQQLSGDIVDDGRQALYRDPIIHVAETAHQEIVVTRRTHLQGTVDVRLFLDGDLQLSSVDEYRYHEALVHPAMSSPALTDGGDVAVLGGGDCLAVRELLRHDTVDTVTLVELDPGVAEVMRSVDELAAIGGDACDDERVTVVTGDAFDWVHDHDDEAFDVVIADFPDPDTPALGRLYSVELYAMLADRIAPDGRLVVQCGSPFFAPEAFWTCRATLRAAGWSTAAYHVDVPSFGDWGFHLAALGDRPPLAVPRVDGLRYLTPAVLDAGAVFPPDRAPDTVDVEPSTILDPTIVDAARRGWVGY